MYSQTRNFTLSATVLEKLQQSYFIVIFTTYNIVYYCWFANSLP